MVKNKLKSIIVGALATVLAIGPAVAIAKTNNGNSNAGNKVTICHATGSRSNPYVQITPNANGVISGHVSHQDSRDIIPSFTYNDHGSTKNFPGQNWDANGQAIFNNGCAATTPGGGGGQMDCDGDFDNSPASECAAQTGGQGGGQVLGAATATGSAAQVVAPQGGVKAGAGGANAFSLTTLQRVW